MSLPLEYTIDHVAGWRWYPIVERGDTLLLWSLNGIGAPHGATVTATCERAVFEQFVSDGMLVPPEHHVAHEDCTCGIHAFRDRHVAFHYAALWQRSLYAFAQVELWGELVAHGNDAGEIEGYRGEHGRVLGVTFDERCGHGYCRAPVAMHSDERVVIPICDACGSDRYPVWSRSDIANALGVEVAAKDYVAQAEAASTGGTWRKGVRLVTASRTTAVSPTHDRVPCPAVLCAACATRRLSSMFPEGV